MALSISYAILWKPYQGIIYLLVGFLLISFCFLPESFIISFLILRPTLDYFDEYKIFYNLNCASILTFLLFIYCLIFLTQHKNEFVLGKFNKLFLFFILICGCSLLYSEHLYISLEHWLRLIVIILIFNYGLLKGAQGLTSRLLPVVLGSAVLPLILGGFQIISNSGNKFTQGFNRIYGTFSHPNMFAFFLAITLFVLLYIRKSQSRKKMWNHILLITIFIELFFTFTRAAWITVFLVFVFFIMFQRRLNIKLIFFFSIPIILIVVFPFIQKRFVDLDPERFGQNSLIWRFNAWSYTIQKVAAHPILGHGIGAYAEDFNFAAHNDYLRLLYETGILGTLSYIISIFYLLRNTFMDYLRDRYKYNKLIISSLLLILLLFGLTDNLLRSTGNLISLFFVLGLLLNTHISGYEIKHPKVELLPKNCTGV